MASIIRAWIVVAAIFRSRVALAIAAMIIHGARVAIITVDQSIHTAGGWITCIHCAVITITAIERASRLTHASHTAVIVGARVVVIAWAAICLERIAASTCRWITNTDVVALIEHDTVYRRTSGTGTGLTGIYLCAGITIRTQ